MASFAAKLKLARIDSVFLGSAMRKLALLAVSAAALLVAACNTVEGVGRDVSAAGRAVTSTASDAKR